MLLLAQYLFRDHIPDVPGIKTQHLRTVLYWMCEHNFMVSGHGFFQTNFGLIEENIANLYYQ